MSPLRPAPAAPFLFPMPPTATLDTQPGESTASSVAFARAFAAEAVAAWWAGVTVSAGARVALPRGPRLPAIAADHRRVARQFGTSLLVLPRLEAAYQLSTAYATRLPASLRARRGVFFTPPTLADRLLDLVTEAGFDWDRGTLCDPACGGGAFTAPAASRIAQRVRARGGDGERILREVERRVHGLELDPFSAWLTRVSLQALALEDSALAGRALEPDIRVCDALVAAAEPAEREFDLVIGNPPFGRVRLDEEARRRYRESLYGHANLYGLFTHRGSQLVRRGGLLAYVTPTSFLGGQYFTNLRSLLLRDAPPVLIDLVRDRTGVFEGVLQETALAVFARGAEPSRALVREVRADERTRAAVATEIGSAALPPRGGGPWMLPRIRGHMAAVRAMERMPHRLADYGYRVSTGPLVWNRHKPQLRWRRSRAALPILWASSVLPAGVFSFVAAGGRRPLFIALSEGQDHLVTRSACVLVQRTTAKEQSRRLVAASLGSDFIDAHGGVVVENHLNMVRPVAGCAALTPETLAEVLNSETIDAVYRCISGSVAVSSYELESLPLPAPDVMHAIEERRNRGEPVEAVDAALRVAYALDGS